MRSSAAAAILESSLRKDLPTFLWGPPGVGKSQIVRQVGERMGLRVADTIRAIHLDPVDLRGVPSISEGLTVWCPPDFLPREGEGLLFLDELNAAPPLTQAGCFQLVEKPHRLGSYQLPSGWKVVGAGNREHDRAVVSRMPSPLLNRFCHIEVEANLDDWIRDYAIPNKLPADLTSFLRFRPDLLAPTPKPDEKAFPSPRSWAEFAVPMIPEESATSLVDRLSTAIGEGAATEFVAFLRLAKKIPDLDKIFKAPDKAPIPKADEPAMLYALCGALAASTNLTNFASLVVYANRLPAEFSVLLMRDCLARNKRLVNTSAHGSWAEKHAEVLI